MWKQRSLTDALDGTIVPPVLLFTAGAPAGLYGEGVERRDVDGAEEGFRLALPFALARTEERWVGYCGRRRGGPVSAWAQVVWRRVVARAEAREAVWAVEGAG